MADWLFLALLATDIAIRLTGASSPRYDEGDLLAPFSIVDQFLHGPAPDAGRQQLLLPALIAGLARGLGVENDVTTLLSFCHGVTAVFSSLCLVPLYLFARRLLSPLHGLAAGLLLSFNAPFHIESYYFNPTQVYAFLLTLSLYFLIVPGRRGRLLAGLCAGLAWSVRHEGIVLFALLAGASMVRRRSGGPVFVHFATPLVALGIGGAAWLARLWFTRTPWVFLSNTAATDSWWAIFDQSWLEVALMMLSISNLLIERSATLVVIHTLAGVALIPLGAIYFSRRDARATLGLAHLALYHAAVAAYLLALPATFERYYYIQWGSVLGHWTRYYHAWTPILVLFVYGGLLYLLDRLIPHPGSRKAMVVFFVLGFGVQQLSSLHFTYHNLPKPDGDVLELAQYFRDRQLENRHVVYAREADGEIVAWPAHGGGQFPDPLYPHPVHLSVLAGHVNVDCWNFDLANPNLNCNGRHDNLELGELEQLESVDYVLTLEASEAAQRWGKLVFEAGRFHLYQAASTDQPALRSAGPP